MLRPEACACERAWHVFAAPLNSPIATSACHGARRSAPAGAEAGGAGELRSTPMPSAAALQTM